MTPAGPVRFPPHAAARGEKRRCQSGCGSPHTETQEGSRISIPVRMAPGSQMLQQFWGQILQKGPCPKKAQALWTLRPSPLAYPHPRRGLRPHIHSHWISGTPHSLSACCTHMGTARFIPHTCTDTHSHTSHTSLAIEMTGCAFQCL